MNLSTKRRYRPRLFPRQILFVFLIVFAIALASDDDDDEISSLLSFQSGSLNPMLNGTQLMSLGETLRNARIINQQRIDAMRKYWNQTLAEIKDLQVRLPETSPLLTQWKLLLDDPESVIKTTTIDEILSVKKDDDAIESTVDANSIEPESADSMKSQKKRFDGFRSWDRLLQEWAEDVADYLERNSVESNGYPLSTFGRPKSDFGEDSVTEETSQSSNSWVSPIKPPPVTLVTKSRKREESKFIPRPVKPGEDIVPSTDLSDKSKSIWIVTTASLPWMTGTAVNPLLRAAYLSQGRKSAGGKVTLMLPWLEDRTDQDKVYGKDRTFATTQDQDSYVRTWLRDTADLPEASRELQLAWYPARLEPAENSIYSMGDLTGLIPSDQVDICVLEEPEHLNWYRAPGENWTTKFKHVVGIIHTNYFFYATEQPAAFVRAPAMRLLCSWMCRAHCHRVIKLSGTLGKFAPEKELVENVHGVRGTFLTIGEEVRQILKSRELKDHPVFAPDAQPSVYFIGKMLWSKGLASLMELLKYAEESANLDVHVDMYGGGPDKEAAEAKSKKLNVSLTFHGPVDHAKLASTHKVFVNPSTSEVLCTTVAEALAMGKFVVLPSHPSNDFFAQFPNCLPYANKEEFVAYLYYALTHSPAPLTEEYAYALSWEAATKRLEAAGSISVEEFEFMSDASESSEIGVEIDLPPLVDDDNRRRKIASAFRLSRSRYRQFRSRLSEEIKQNKVLPTEIQRRLTMELDKRLDIDIDAIMESPKLRIQLSPAELDKRLLNFYNDIIRGPSGDVLRVISGGTNVGMQNLYMKRQAKKRRRRELSETMINPLTDPSEFLDQELPESDEVIQTPIQGISVALRRNLPYRSGEFVRKASPELKVSPRDDSTKPKMSMMMMVPLKMKMPISKRMSGPLV